MDLQPNLRIQDLEELSRIWYEHQVLGAELRDVQEKFYKFVERVFQEETAIPEENKAQVTRRELPKNNRQVLAERLLLTFQYDRRLSTSLEHRCLELLRTSL